MLHRLGGEADIPVVFGRPVPAEALSRTLDDAFGLVAAQWERVPAGERSTGIRAVDSEGDRWFVKVASATAGVHALEEGSADQAERARAAGVPVPTVRRTRGGASVAPVRGGESVAAVRVGASGDQASDAATPPVLADVSVMAWVDGETLIAPVDPDAARQAGVALGRMHAAFAPLASYDRATAENEPWLRWDATALATRTDRVKRRVEDCLRRDGAAALGHTAAFDERVLADLDERAEWADAVRAVLDRMPPLTVSVGHGDAAVPNLLYRDGELVAVLDFAPPRPTRLAAELGRLAAAPELLADDGWRPRTRAVLDGYREARPDAPQDVTAAALACAFVQLARSMYPANSLHEGHAAHPDDAMRFWAKRQRAARLLREELA